MKIILGMSVGGKVNQDNYYNINQKHIFNLPSSAEKRRGVVSACFY